MLETIHDPLTTSAGTPLPSLVEVIQVETVREGPQNEATTALLSNPTEENRRRYIDATLAHIEALKTAALCAMRLTPAAHRRA